MAKEAGGFSEIAFSEIARDAKVWLATPDDARLARLATEARSASERAPSSRRRDWEKLLAGFAKDETPDRRRARVEGLVRACRLFEREERAARAEIVPLAWDDPVEKVSGLGPASREALATQGIVSVGDLVWLLPSAWDDLRAPLGIADAARLASESALGRTARVCVRGIVKSASLVPMRGRRAVRIVLADEGDPKKTLHAWWFFAAHGVLSSAKASSACLVVGRVMDKAPRAPTIAHPDLVPDEPSSRIVRPRYPRFGVAEATLRKSIATALRRVATLPDPVPPKIASREHMPSIESLLRALHGAVGAPPTDDERRAVMERLAWAEAFTRVRARLEAEARQGKDGKGRAPPLARDRAVLARFVAELGFAPTRGQTRAIDAISKELASASPMRRLLLGDVGTGKTAVALAAAAQCVRAGYQVAILVPTSILAEQYMDAAAPLARATGASIAQLTAALPAARRRLAADGIASGDIAVAIGTHALLAEGVRFSRLGLVIVDEQHRLGVAQRLALVEKGLSPHLLTLSATPIPRTLALALRGELATSVLDERPKGRPPVATELRARGGFDAIVADLRSTVLRGERAFFVSPRIEDDDDGDAIDGVGDPTSGVVARAAELARKLAPAKVALVHGALSGDAKRAAMRAFRTGEAQVLVGTTVIEVGIDVPEATLMVIDGAERFGLAQLHQMRGRVGRGAVPGRCLLVHDAPLDAVARRRLEALAAHTDGADIARIDLELRGAGDLGGTRQSGIEEELLFLDPANPPAWLERIEADARAILRKDPTLAKVEHIALGMAARRFGAALSVREEAG
jgi:ATP-dependent DNA helicase RecG